MRMALPKNEWLGLGRFPALLAALFVSQIVALGSAPPATGQEAVQPNSDGAQEQVDEGQHDAGGQESATFAPEDFDDKLVSVQERTIEIRETILFFFAEARIKPESFSILNKLADTLKSRPTIRRVRIAGHTDSVGPDDFNLTLSLLRAEAVKAFLVEHGINPARLTTKGLGENNPRVPNNSPKRRQTNRRVEFQLVKQGQVVAKGPAVLAGADVVMLRGEVYIVTGENDGRLVTLRERLRSGVALATGPRARMVLRLPDLGLVAVGANTRIKLTRIELAGEDGRRNLSIKLVHGDIEVRDRDGGRSVVFTPWASATGHSAHFRAVTGADGTLMITTDRGVVEVSAAGNLTSLLTGMATLVPRQGQAIAPATRLPPPTANTGRHLEDKADLLTWTEIAGATSYLVLVSSDPAGLDVQSTLPTNVAALAPQELPVTSEGFWWRVAAVDALGIPGKLSVVYNWTRPSEADPRDTGVRAAQR